MKRRLNSRNVPQADRLADVVKAVEAVAKGASTSQEIATAINKDDRQGRYYRHATELLGLTRNVAGTNESTLTDRGERLLSLPINEERRVLLASAVLDVAVEREVFELIVARPACTFDSIGSHLHSEGLNRATAGRRTSTVLAWLIDLGLVYRDNDTFRAVWRPSAGDDVVEILNGQGISGPSAPASTELGALLIPDLTPRDPDIVQYEIDLAKTERAMNAHVGLVQRMARVLRRCGITPYSSPLIDLLADYGSMRYLFEMKSCKQTNVHRQTRRAVSQLLEYRYVYQLDQPLLCAVLETEPSGKRSWLVDYLGSLQIAACWPSHDTGFSYPPAWSQSLGLILDA
jgi:hypothetical protein